MPFSKSAQKKGGAITARKSREEALSLYYKNPNICEHCKQVIKVAENQKVRAVRKKKFCNQSCAQSFNNAVRYRKNRVKRVCTDCGGDMTYLPHKTKFRVRCPQCASTYKERKADAWYKKTAKKKKKDSSFREIGLHARRTLERAGAEKECLHCTYSLHVEAAHLRAVRTFKPTNLLRTINRLENLVYLCRRCHWEFDHGHLDRGDFLND